MKTGRAFRQGQSPTCGRGIADREGAQRGVQAVDGILEVLGEEDVALHRLAGQSVELLPSDHQQTDPAVKPDRSSRQRAFDVRRTWGSGGPRQTRPRQPV